MKNTLLMLYKVYNILIYIFINVQYFSAGWYVSGVILFIYFSSAETLAAEIKELQGQLADYNTVSLKKFIILWKTGLSTVHICSRCAHKIFLQNFSIINQPQSLDLIILKYRLPMLRFSFCYILQFVSIQVLKVVRFSFPVGWQTQHQFKLWRLERRLWYCKYLFLVKYFPIIDTAKEQLQTNKWRRTQFGLKRH